VKRGRARALREDRIKKREKGRRRPIRGERLKNSIQTELTRFEAEKKRGIAKHENPS